MAAAVNPESESEERDHRSVEELKARLTEIPARQVEIDSEHAGKLLPPEAAEEFESLENEKRELEKLVSQLEERQAVIERSASKPRGREEGASFHTPRAGAVSGDEIYDLSTVRSSVGDPVEAGSQLRSRALRSVEAATFQHPDAEPGRTRTHIEGLLSRDTEDGKFARYLLSVGSPTYKRAFGKYLSGQERTREETAALVTAQAAERALSLTGASGGFAVPYELDPTILNTSNGVVNPIRAISRVEQITVDEWRGVTSTGITASYAAEATETTDNAPTLVQPTVSTEKAQAWVPFSIEVGQDWSGLQQQMSTLLADAKDTLEATKFIAGTGTNEPFGVAVGTTNTVNAAAGADAFTLANLYSLVGALPPRYRANASMIGDLLILNRIRQFDTVGSSAAIWVDSLQDGVASRLLGKPIYEASAMPDDATTGNKFLIFGDFSRYLIVDRVGLTVEVVPHVFGSNQRPTGQRGLYAYWRNGAKVLDANAFRALLGTA